MAFLVNFGCILATGMNFCPIFLFFYKCGLLLRNVATSFRKAVITREVMAFLVDFGWNLATGMNFCSIFLYFCKCGLLQLQNRATSFRKAAITRCEVTVIHRPSSDLLPSCWYVCEYMR